MAGSALSLVKLLKRLKDFFSAFRGSSGLIIFKAQHNFHFRLPNNKFFLMGPLSESGIL